MPTVATVWGGALSANYRSVAGATLFAYDSLLLFPTELEQEVYWYELCAPSDNGWLSHLNRNKQQGRSRAAIVYVAMKLFAILYFICMMAVWGTSLTLDIGYVVAIKMILVLRLRAIYGYSHKVSILLYALMAIQLYGCYSEWFDQGALGALVALVGTADPPWSKLYDHSALVLCTSPKGHPCLNGLG
ncbi:hypothetical protein NP233_g11444 [Leucocoprinus birnbaumii]|uniref:Uncharacterized protein n=1 Tax=Leucocoprinus birnbaumii TaxID=56174 RepID=A0AAD5VGE8_9AGAR|nr:hypothetical protein NP233_g11444 [Leucocoprinus birnbaumii]